MSAQEWGRTADKPRVPSCIGMGMGHIGAALSMALAVVALGACADDGTGALGDAAMDGGEVARDSGSPADMGSLQDAMVIDLGADGGEDLGSVDTLMHEEPPVVEGVSPRRFSTLRGDMPRVWFSFSKPMQPASTIGVYQQDLLSGEAEVGFAPLTWTRSATAAELRFRARPASEVFIDVTELTDLSGNRVVASERGSQFAVQFRTE